jgi:TPR repeat protein
LQRLEARLEGTSVLGKRDRADDGDALFIQAMEKWWGLSDTVVDGFAGSVLAELASDRGSDEALAWCMLEGWGREKNIDNALVLLESAISQHGSPMAMALLAYHTTDNKLRLEMYTRSASAGCALGHNGLGRASESVAESIAHYSRGADAGHAESRSSLAFQYDEGKVVEHDCKRAVALWQKAAAQVHKTSLVALFIFCYRVSAWPCTTWACATRRVLGLHGM